MMSNATNGTESDLQGQNTSSASKSLELNSALPLDPERSDGLTDQTNYVPRRQIISIFLACATVSITGLFDETMVAVAMPIISSDLGGGKQVAWVSTSFFVASTSCQLLYGRLSDIWSRKSVLFTLMAIFFIGNLGCAFSTTFVEFLIFRGIAGIGGGGLPTVAQVIVSDTVTMRERGKYQGILGISVAFANGVGPLIGGAFAEKSTWRWCFRMILPLTVFSALCVHFFMPLKPVSGDWKVKLRRVDFIGGILILSSATLLVMGLTWGGSYYPWASSHVLATLCVGSILAVVFIIWEMGGSEYPLLPMGIWRRRIVIGAGITHFINGYLTIVQVFFLPTFYQLAYGYSPVKSASLLLILTVVQSFISSFSGLVITWTGRYRELLLCGWAMWAVGLGLISSLNGSSPLSKQLGYSLFTGFAVGQTLQPSLVAVQNAVDRKDMAVVTAMRSFVRNIGGTLGLAVSGTITTNVFLSNLQRLDIDAATYQSLIDDPLSARLLVKDPTILNQITDGYRRGFRLVFITMAALSVLAFFVSFFLMRNDSLIRADDEQLKKEAKERITEAERNRRG